MLKLVSQNDPVLCKKAKRVEQFDDRLGRLVSNMKKIMGEEDGIGLAAPQMGKSLQVFVVDERLIRESEEKRETSKLKKVKRLFRKKIHDTFINPEALSVSKDGWLLEEGCLSVPGIFGQVPRAKKITVRAQNERGRWFTVKAERLYAHVLQHEIDHLGGVLFVEKAIKESLHKIKKTSYDK